MTVLLFKAAPRPPKIAALPCPICHRPVTPDECQPWPAHHGSVRWYIGCYALDPHEHHVGVNGDSESDAVRAWNVEVSKIRHRDVASVLVQFPSVVVANRKSDEIENEKDQANGWE